jgi:hypothetical protein
MTIPYRFMPWSRRGLARAHANVDTAAGALATRPRITVGLTLQARQDGNAATAVSGNIDLTLYGPADVIGIDQRLIVRTDPRPNTTNFEPNYLAIVDFDPPDFPWMLTPARADATGHLRPWLVLVVVERKKVAPPTLRAGRPLPSISLTATQVQSELPDLAESWLWAHSQAVSTVDVVTPPTPETQAAAAQTLSTEMRQSPERNISRLVCPRRLTPRTDYVACVVPATEGGRLRGLGQPVAGDTLGLAWSKQAANDHRTDPCASRGHSRPVSGRHRDAGATPARQRNTEATRRCSRNCVTLANGRVCRWRPPTVRRTDARSNGLRRRDGVAGVHPGSEQCGLCRQAQEILNSGSSRVADGTDPAAHVPTLAPPIYGEYPAKRHTVTTTKVNRHWLDGLSLQPRYRLAAGWGAEVVRQNQDEFMQAAWAQLGDVLAAERAFSLARLARDVLKRVEARHLAKLSPDRALAVMSPAVRACDRCQRVAVWAHGGRDAAAGGSSTARCAP